MGRRQPRQLLQQRDVVSAGDRGPADSLRAGDPTDDIVAHFLELAQLPADQAEAIEREVRRVWGGERPYIPKLGELGRRLISARDEQIRREYGRGERMPLLVRRWGLSPRHIRRILGDDMPPAERT